jgi:hypothetical protein
MALVIQFPLIPLFSKKSHVAPLLQVCKSIAKVLLVNRYFLANDDRLKFLFHTPSGLVNEVVLDMIWVKHWEYKSWITFKLLDLDMRKLHE